MRYCRFLFIPFLFLTFGIGSGSAQSVYPPIQVDSAALADKIQYLGELESLSLTGPNIIILLADDLGKNDLSLYDTAGVPTPNIDQMAREGILFTEAYASSAVCNPSRAGLLTGRYQQRFGNELQIMRRYARNGVEHFAFKNFVNTSPLQLTEPWYSPPEEEIRKQGLPPSELSLFELMQSLGYRTGCMGKWHLGYNEPFLPADKGVDDFYGFYEAFSLYAPGDNEDIINHRHKSFHNKYIWRQKRKGPSAIVRNGVEIEEVGYLTLRIAEEACRFIAENRENPFMLYVPFSAPHTPFQAPAEYCRKFGHINDLNRQVYYAMISALDDAVGSIMEQVRESGIENNTMVFFSSDNGGASYTGATDNGGLKGGKMTHFEGGLNVPLILKWKGSLPGGSQYHEPVSLLDIYPTVISVFGHLPSQPGQPDGVDLMPFLSGKDPGPPHEYLFWRTGFNKTIRYGSWKLLVNSRNGLTFLYDLENDKQEQSDLSAGHPELIGKMLTALSEWESGLIPPLWPAVMEYEVEIDGQPMRFAF